MDIKLFRDFFEQSFDDKQLSRNEASVFKQLLEEHYPNPQQLNLLRHEAFECAKKVLRHPEDRDVTGWLSDLMKILLQFAPAPEAGDEEALFFPNPASYKRLLEVLKQARERMDICVFTITDNRISDILIDAHNKGVKIRIISDDDKAMDLGSDLITLNKEGIPICVDQSADHMHHKFAILDQKILLNGSYNWTRSASTRNHENLTVTHSHTQVRAFQQEFNHLWARYYHSPEKHT